MNQCERVTGVTATRPVHEIVRWSKLRGLVLSCKGDSEEKQFLPYISQSVGGTIWISHWIDADESHIVSEAMVRNAVLRSRPDVELLREEDSAFYGGADDE